LLQRSTVGLIAAFRESHFQTNALVDCATKFHFCLGPGKRPAPMRDSRLGHRSPSLRCAVMTSPGLDPAVAAGPFEHLIGRARFLFVTPNFLAQLRSQRLNAHTKPAADHAPCPTNAEDLFGMLEGMAKRCLREVDDGRIDAITSPRRLKRWAAGISGVDRGIGLNEILRTARD